MAIENALIQGVVSGGITGITLIFLIKYILPKLDKIEDSMIKVSSNVTIILNSLLTRK